VIGGRVLAAGIDPTGARLGRGDLLVAEADESDGSFLRLAPVIAVITNIDPEHLDHYGSVDALREAFVSFANRVPFWGLTVLCLDHPGVQAIVPRMTRRTITYGFSSQADLVAEEVAAESMGMRFRVRRRGERLGEVHLRLPGRHNVSNALATLATLRTQGRGARRAGHRRLRASPGRDSRHAGCGARAPSRPDHRHLPTASIHPDA
jgi:UDP-N-acetylmuramate--alanine ligase